MAILAVSAGCLLVVALWEYLRPRRGRQFPALRRRVANLGCWIVNLVLTGFLLGSPWLARAGIEAGAGIRLPAWPFGDGALGALFGFLLLDLLRYLVHRCEHSVRLLWRLHALHHSDPDVDVTTAVRHHPFEYTLASTFYWLTTVIFAIPSGALLGHGLAVFAAAAVQHANIRLPARLDRRLRYLVVTNDMHRIHHSASPVEANANYGAVLSVWDRLFGTYREIAPRQHEAIVFGVRELPRPGCMTPGGMLRTPWTVTSLN